MNLGSFFKGAKGDNLYKIYNFGCNCSQKHCLILKECATDLFHHKTESFCLYLEIINVYGTAGGSTDLFCVEQSLVKPQEEIERKDKQKCRKCSRARI